MAKSALITGITGQDGSYLAEHLLAKGYDVHGLVRRASTASDERITHLHGRVRIHYGDLIDQASIDRIIHTVRPDEVYHLGAMSFVEASFSTATSTAEYTALGTTRMLEAIRRADWPVRFYQASSSEMYGDVLETPQTEHTPLRPRSPYGVAKTYAHHITVNMRESYGLHASCGILFNHESPRRGLEFVTRRISRGVAEIYLGRRDVLTLGNLAARRDWGFAGDYVHAMWLMLQQDTPSDYVIATGEMHSVEEFVEAAFRHVGITDWRNHVRIDPALMRPAEVHVLCGDASRARNELGWKSEVSFDKLVRMMVDYDVASLSAPEVGIPRPRDVSAVIA